jgi:hypothetical protein
MAVTAELSPAQLENYFGFGKQANKGTGVPPVYWAAYMEAVELSHNPAIRSIREAGSGMYVARDVRDAMLPGFRFAAPARPELAGAIFAYFLGTAGISGAADPYTHTLTPSTGMNWLSVERNISDEIIERLVDCWFTEVTLDLRKRDAGPEAILVVTGQGLSAAYQATATAESYEADRPALRSDATWSIGGTAFTNVERATVTLRWVLDEAIMADAITRISAAKLRFEGTVEIVQVVNAHDEVDAYREIHYTTADAGADGTAYAEPVYGHTTGGFSVDMAWTNSASKAREVKLEIPTLNWDEAKITEPDPGASEAVRLTRTGHLVKPASAAAVTVTTKSSKAAGYLA